MGHLVEFAVTLTVAGAVAAVVAVITRQKRRRGRPWSKLDVAANAPGTSPEESDSVNKTLMPDGPPSTPEEKAQLFELYKMMVQTSESLVSRRQGTNTFFLTANGLLLTAIGLFAREGATTRNHGIVIALLCMTGAIIAWGWRNLIVSFGQLNKGKFAVILRLEKALSAAIFDAEWEALDRGRNKQVYRSFTESEKRVPIIFMGVYAAAFIAAALISLGRLELP